MKNISKLKFLGSSDSAGIPVHNCTCTICTEYRHKKKTNLASCAYIEINNEIILIDAGHENISNIFDGKKITAVLLTHFHADHCLGLLRLRHSAQNIICIHPKDKEGFSDLYKHKYSLTFIENTPFEKSRLKDIFFTAIPLKHSKNTTGYLIEYKKTKLAYLSDCFALGKESMNFLKQQSLDYIFIDACYDERKEKGNHLNYKQAEKILDDLGAKKSFLIHGSHETLNYIQENNIKLKYTYVKENFEVNFPT